MTASRDDLAYLPAHVRARQDPRPARERVFTRAINLVGEYVGWAFEQATARHRRHPWLPDAAR